MKQDPWEDPLDGDMPKPKDTVRTPSEPVTPPTVAGLFAMFQTYQAGMERRRMDTFLRSLTPRRQSSQGGPQFIGGPWCGDDDRPCAPGANMIRVPLGPNVCAITELFAAAMWGDSGLHFGLYERGPDGHFHWSIP